MTMNASLARQHASAVLAAPVVSDDDVLARVSAIVEPAHRLQPALWLFFIDKDGIQANVIVPVSDIPAVPELKAIGNLCQVIAHVIGSCVPGGRAVVTLARPGTVQPRQPDRDWLIALRWGMATYGTPIRMLCLATPDGVRELGPVSAT
jgi:hypothetical protein